MPTPSFRSMRLCATSTWTAGPVKSFRRISMPSSPLSAMRQRVQRKEALRPMSMPSSPMFTNSTSVAIADERRLSSKPSRVHVSKRTSSSTALLSLRFTPSSAFRTVRARSVSVEFVSVSPVAPPPSRTLSSRPAPRIVTWMPSRSVASGNTPAASTISSPAAAASSAAATLAY